MNVPEQLKKFLHASNVQHELITHPEAFTAQEVARAIHKTGKVLAKTVVVEADGKYVMTVVPAHHKVSLNAVKAVLAAKDVHLAKEEKLSDLFPDCQLGAMPPIGPIYNLPVVVSKALAEKPEIIFNACTHTDCLKMKYADFEKVVNPQVAEISDIPPESR
ncbi:MAG: aminoacyl-tRNA deacylase [Bacteroidota bacterium]